MIDEVKHELKHYWGVYLLLGLVIVFGVYIVVTSPTTPQVTRQWTLEDGTVCRKFTESNAVTCVKGNS